MTPVPVTAAVIEKDGKILLAKRKPGGALGGMWEFPGGKIDPGETPQECVRRELREELALEVEVGPEVVRAVHRYDRGVIELVAFRATIVSGEPQLLDHQELVWVEPSKLLDYQLCPADLPVARAVLGK